MSATVYVDAAGWNARFYIGQSDASVSNTKKAKYETNAYSSRAFAVVDEIRFIEE